MGYLAASQLACVVRRIKGEGECGGGRQDQKQIKGGGMLHLGQSCVSSKLIQVLQKSFRSGGLRGVGGEGGKWPRRGMILCVSSLGR